MLEEGLQLDQGFDAREFFIAIRAGDIEEHSLHSSIARTDIIHRIHVTDIEAAGGIGIHRTQRGSENVWVRLLEADGSRVGDRGKAVANAAAREHSMDLAVGVGNHSKRIFLTDAIEGLARSGKDLIPIRGALRILYQFVADSFVERIDLLQQVGVEGPPKAVIDFPLAKALIKFVLSAALEGLPTRSAWDAFPRVTAQDPRTIGEEQRVADVEENETRTSHDPY